MSFKRMTYTLLLLNSLLSGCNERILSISIQDELGKTQEARLYVNNTLLGTVRSSQTLKIPLAQLPDGMIYFRIESDDLENLSAPGVVNYRKNDLPSKIIFKIKNIQGRDETLKNNPFAESLEKELDIPIQELPAPSAENFAIQKENVLEKNRFIDSTTKIESEKTENTDNTKVIKSDLLKSTEENKEKAQQKNVWPKFPIPSFSAKTLIINNEQNQVIEGAQIFLGKNGNQSIRYLGKTDNQGTLTWQESPLWKTDTLFIRHPCCQSQNIPLPGGNQTQVTMFSNKSSKDIFVLQYIYDTLRGVEQAELWDKNTKVDVSNTLGILKDSRTNHQDVQHHIVYSEGWPSRLPVTDKNFQTIFMRSKRYLPPRVALVDLTNTTKNEWIRFRRELQGLWSKETKIRTMLPAEAERLAVSSNMKTEDLIQGWKEKPIHYEIDFIWSLHWNERKEEWFARLTNRSGELMSWVTWKLDDVPELSGKIVMEKMLEEIPFELSVDGKNEAYIPNELESVIQSPAHFLVFCSKNSDDEPIHFCGKTAVERHKKNRLKMTSINQEWPSGTRLVKKTKGLALKYLNESEHKMQFSEIVNATRKANLQ